MMAAADNIVQFPRKLEQFFLGQVYSYSHFILRMFKLKELWCDVTLLASFKMEELFRDACKTAAGCG